MPKRKRTALSLEGLSQYFQNEPKDLEEFKTVWNAAREEIFEIQKKDQKLQTVSIRSPKKKLNNTDKVL